MQEEKGEAFLSSEIAKLSEKLQKDPSSKLFFPLAEEYIKCSMLEEAIMILTEGLKIHPAFSAARVSLGKVYLQKGRIAEAKAELEKVVAQNPDNLMAQKKLALIYRDEGNIEKAKQISEAILSSNAKDPEMERLVVELEKLQTKPPATTVSQAPTVEPASFQATPEAASPVAVNPPSFHQTPLESPTPVTSTQDQQGQGDSEGLALPDHGGHGACEGEWRGEEEAPSTRADESPPEAERRLDSDPRSGHTSHPPQADWPGHGEIASGPPKAESSPPYSNGVGASEPLTGLSRAQGPPHLEQDHEERTPPDSEERKAPMIQLNLNEADGGLDEEDIFSELLGPSPAKSQGPPAPVPSQMAIRAFPPKEEEAPVSEGDLATVAIAELYIQQGHYEQGIEIYRKILEQDPDNAEVRQRLEDALALANLLTKRPKETRRPPLPPSNTQEAPTSNHQSRSSAEQLRQAKLQRLQAWLEQLKRSQNP